MEFTEEQLKDPKWWRSFLGGRYIYDEISGYLYNKKGEKITKKNKDGYLVINTRVNMRRYEYLVHRVAFLLTVGRWPKFIDHIDGNPSNNKWLNLREVTHSENMKNQKCYKNNKTGILGVYMEGDKYKSSIQSNGVRVSLGKFDNLFDACCARKSAELVLGFHSNHGRSL